MATIINGVTTAQEIKEEIAQKVNLIREQGGSHTWLPYWSAMTVPARLM